MNCTVCGSSQVEIKFNLTPERQILCCLKCGVEFLFPQLNDTELHQLYSENYYKAWGISGNSENESTKQMKIATFQLRLDLIKKYVSTGKILDVGCATGYFLEAAREGGYGPYGVELSEYSATIAKQKFGEEKIYNGTIETCKFADGMFDVIAMSDLIEHVRIPEQTLKKAAALLKDDGVIMIMTPDTKTVSNNLMGTKWTHYKLEHFFYFSHGSMCFLASLCGLEVVHYEKSKKALNFEYLHTQYNVYKHWLLTPAVKTMNALLPSKLRKKNFYFSIGEMVVILKKKKS
ncbi:MAG: methyltransferase [Bacteroidota bacterium]|jgi:2-polyprenyl-3-methyl-5-hydroxy-6-metoxy-1,4-benzoquinol methylase|nr:methyltransferase [Bacteroidota bacterium]